jgi:hypothetical protein
MIDAPVFIFSAKLAVPMLQNKTKNRHGMEIEHFETLSGMKTAV